jgi:hypothetical protein
MATHTLKIWFREQFKVRLYGVKTGGAGVSLKYGVNDSGTPENTDFSLTTSGQLVKTFYVDPNDTVYISNDQTREQCSQEGENTYCSTYTCSLESFIITGNTDISTEVGLNSC